MAQRHEPDDSLDDFPTQPWGSRALCEMLGDRTGIVLPNATCWEPAANRGYMSRPLAEYFKSVVATDIFDYGQGFGVMDFLWPVADDVEPFDIIASNPPFRLAEQFIQTALDRATVGVAMLCRSSFSEGVGRYNKIFRDNRPTYVWQFVERLPMVKGRVDQKASTATSYAWYVWMKTFGARGRQTIYDWIPPCRRRLEREGDYDAKENTAQAV